MANMILNVPVNNFSVMLGRSHRFLGITSTFWGVQIKLVGSKVSLSLLISQGSGPPAVQVGRLFHNFSPSFPSGLMNGKMIALTKVG